MLQDLEPYQLLGELDGKLLTQEEHALCASKAGWLSLHQTRQADRRTGRRSQT